MKTVPTLLVCDELVDSIATQYMEIDTHKNPTPENFLFCYALFEGLLRELSFQLYYAFPKKLNGLSNDTTNSNNRFEIEKDDLFMTNDYYFVLNKIIDKKLYKLSKDNLYNFLSFFFEHTGISFDINKELLSQMTKARNIIAHNNGYKVKYWSIKSEMLNSIVEEPNLQKYLEYIIELTDLINSKIDKKFEKYTYEKLLLDSWNYTCPELSIYDIFYFKSGKAKIRVKSAIENISKLPPADKYLVSIWIENYNINYMYKIMSKVGEVYPSTGIANRDKLHYLQQLFIDFPYLLDGHPFLTENGKIKI